MNFVCGTTVCPDITELNAENEGSIIYPGSGFYAADMKCQWRVHAPAGMVNICSLL